MPPPDGLPPNGGVPDGVEDDIGSPIVAARSLTPGVDGLLSGSDVDHPSFLFLDGMGPPICSSRSSFGISQCSGLDDTR